MCSCSYSCSCSWICFYFCVCSCSCFCSCSCSYSWCCSCSSLPHPGLAMLLLCVVMVFFLCNFLALIVNVLEVKMGLDFMKIYVHHYCQGKIWMGRILFICQLFLHGSWLKPTYICMCSTSAVAYVDFTKPNVRQHISVKILPPHLFTQGWTTYFKP